MKATRMGVGSFLCEETIAEAAAVVQREVMVAGIGREKNVAMSSLCLSLSHLVETPRLLLRMLKGAGQESKPPWPPAFSHGQDGVLYSTKWGHSQ